MQLALEFPRAQGRSVRAPLEFKWEPFSAVARELPPLFRRHWQEIAYHQDGLPLDPDWDTYYNLELAGVLRVFTVRSNGALVGYHFVLVLPHLHHHATLSAQTDMFWLDPVFREGSAGYRLLRQARDDLKSWGVKHHRIQETLHTPTLRPLLTRLGYKPVETVYDQVL